jgi:hypothetical protein
MTSPPVAEAGNLPIEGGCLCGGVRFSAKPPTLFCCHCHCAWCRKAHGAAFVTWFGVRDEAFSLTRGAETVRWYRSSEKSERGFCPTCGTTMFFRSTLAQGEMHIALACADGPIDRAPHLHVFFEARAPWVTTHDELPHYDRDHPALKKYQAVSREPK